MRSSGRRGDRAPKNTRRGGTGSRQALVERGIDALFVPPSSDLEYLTGLERDLPSFGNLSYAHGWVAGAFLAPGREPLFVLPRMVVQFHLGGEAPEGAIVVREDDDGRALFSEAVGPPGLARASRARRPHLGRDGARAASRASECGAARGLDARERAAAREVGRRARVDEPRLRARARGDGRGRAACRARRDDGRTSSRRSSTSCAGCGSRCPSFPTHIFTWGERRLDSGDATATTPLAEGEVVLFDFGAVVEGYCSDFGRTVVCGEAPAGYEEAHATMVAAQEAGRAAAVPGALAREVNAACRAPIEEAGLGAGFRHRMGHGIGLDVHERPFLSVEDETPLEAGMTFTDEPSILVDGRFGVRVEDVIAVTDTGGRML